MTQQTGQDPRAAELVREMYAVITAQTAAEFRQRSFLGLKRMWVDSGLGLPGVTRFGFKRDKAGRLNVDPSTWPLVEMLFARAAAGVTRRALAAELERAGQVLSPRQIGRILRDPIYVSGEFTVSWEGSKQLCRTAQIPKPISREQWDAAQ